MKLTIEIPDAHTGDVLRFLASMIPANVEIPADPAPGHPELPLDDEDPALADVRWGLVEPEATPGIDAADPLKVAMADPVEDNRPSIAPQVGMQFFTRTGKVAHIESRRVSGLFRGTIDIDSEFHDYNWNPDGSSASDFRGFDLVEPTPF